MDGWMDVVGISKTSPVLNYESCAAFVKMDSTNLVFTDGLIWTIHGTGVME